MSEVRDQAHRDAISPSGGLTSVQKFNADIRAEIDAVTMTEDDHFICEAAQQFGFHICNDDATVFSCDQEVLVAFVRRVIRHTKAEMAGPDERFDCCEVHALTSTEPQSVSVQKPRPANCPNSMSCEWQHVKTEPEIGLWFCSAPHCPNASQPSPAATVETKPFSAKENLREVVAQVQADIEAAQLRCSADKATAPKGSLKERIAINLWHRFAPESHMEWEEETHQAEYVLAADDVLFLTRNEPQGAGK